MWIWDGSISQSTGRDLLTNLIQVSYSHLYLSVIILSTLSSVSVMPPLLIPCSPDLLQWLTSVTSIRSMS